MACLCTVSISVYLQFTGFERQTAARSRLSGGIQDVKVQKRLPIGGYQGSPWVFVVAFMLDLLFLYTVCLFRVNFSKSNSFRQSVFTGLTKPQKEHSKKSAMLPTKPRLKHKQQQWMTINEMSNLPKKTHQAKSKPEGLIATVFLHRVRASSCAWFSML